MTAVSVALGGALGALLRWGVGLLVAFPFGTLAVNVLGSFVMGVFLVLLVDKGADRWVPFLMTGLLGGFTTFSAFSLDTLRLWEAGAVLGALAYVMASVLLSLLAVFAAVFVARGLGL